MQIELCREEIKLLPEKAIWWGSRSMLILSDLHIGKAGHFRRNGIAIPELVNKNNYWILSGLLDRLKPRRVVFLGDLFHSVLNDEWNDFVDFLGNYPGSEWILVEGNHDILSPEYYEKAGIRVVQELIEGPFRFVHEEDGTGSDRYTLSGHVHPCVRIRGEGRQGFRLECFAFGKESGLLPAFGTFTGTHAIKPRKQDRIFVVAGGEVMSLPEL